MNYLDALNAEVAEAQAAHEAEYVAMLAAEYGCAMKENETLYFATLLGQERPPHLRCQYVPRPPEWPGLPLPLGFEPLTKPVAYALDAILSSSRDESIVYIVRVSSDAVKIGFTRKSVRNRIAKFENGNPNAIQTVASFPGDRQLETSLHRVFRKHRLKNRRELFTINDDIGALVRILSSSGFQQRKIDYFEKRARDAAERQAIYRRETQQRREARLSVSAAHPVEDHAGA
jgi:hypothetical protein